METIIIKPKDKAELNFWFYNEYCGNYSFVRSSLFCHGYRNFHFLKPYLSKKL